MTRLEEVLGIVNANSDEAFDDLSDLMKPDDFTRDQLGSAYESAVGYNPITYYEKKELNTSIDALKDTDTLTDHQEDYIDANRGLIVDDAYDRYDKHYRSRALNDALVDALSDHCGVDYSATEELQNNDDEIEGDYDIDD